jgi:hypothetical protein
VRVGNRIARGGLGLIAVLVLSILGAGPAWAQEVQVTPASSITPDSNITSWVWQIAVASAILAVLTAIGITLAYMRHAPRFSGRKAKAQPAAAPGSRPPALARQAAAVRWTPPADGGHAAAPAPSGGGGTATAVLERPEESEAPVAEAPAEAPPTEAPPTEPPPTEPPPSAPPAETPAAPPTGPQPSAPAETPAAPPTPAPAAEAASHGSGAMDQETFDRVLEEQLAKGVDKRVAEGRARAAAVVAARKKAQG